MSQKYFSNFPLIDYKDSATRNIILKSQFFRSVINSAGAFYTYVVRDGERPDTIAFDYYGDSDYAWIVYFSNNIIDPYFEWPMDSLQFEEFIIKKYGSIPAAMEEIVYYAYNSSVDPDDPEYEYNLSYKMDTITYDYKVGYPFSGNGTITANTSSNIVVGSQTDFVNQLLTGYTLYGSSSVILGTVDQITDSTHLTLTANSTTNITSSNFTYRVKPEDSTFQANHWIAKNAYDYELDKNDANRNIKLLSSVYLNQINREISNIFKK